MANMITANVYNHYMTTYFPKKMDARLDSHNKNELKNICGRILKLNKEAPLYVYDRSTQTASFALALKEDARQLQYTILDSAGSKDDLFQNKVTFSSDEDIISAKYIGGSCENLEEPVSHEIRVHNLASGQVNLGNFLPSGEPTLEAGIYAFNVHVNNFTYEFEVTVNGKDTNLDVQSRLAHLLNQANLGLYASVVEGDENTSGLKIESLQTGENTASGAPLFQIQSTSGSDAFLDYFGIDSITEEASNANFSLDGEEMSTSGNQFTIDDTYEITLHGVSSDTEAPVTIGVKTNIDSLKYNVYNLISGYNAFLQAADQYKNITSSNKLSFEIQKVARLYRKELDTIGINLSNTGALSVDESLLTQTAQSKEADDLLSPLKSFSSSLFKKGEEISRDPLSYANKKIVAYKNPGRSFTSPYAASSYSGLLFSSYC